MEIKNPNVKQAVKIVTVAGASVLVVGSALALMKAKSAKEVIMPAVAILVGVSAFGYAMAKPKVVADEKKSNAFGDATSEKTVENSFQCNNGMWVPGPAFCKSAGTVSVNAPGRRVRGARRVK